MRRGTSLIVGVALGACDTGGLEIIVYGPADPGTPVPSTVKLYIGHGDDTQNAIAPAPVGTQRFSASRWDRAHDNVDDSAKLVDGVATFVFRSDGSVGKLPVVVAVGLDAQGIATSSAVMFDLDFGNANVKAYSVGLNKVSDPIATHGTGFNGLLRWGPSSRTGHDDACVLAQNTYPDPTSRSVFIVTEGDRDCDGVPDEPTPPECQIDVWNGSRPPRLGELSCLLTKPIGSNEPLCLAGGPPCQDGGGGAGTCAESRYCAHDALCTTGVCGTGAGGWSCAQEVGASAVPTFGYPAMQCTFSYHLDNNGSGVFSFCPGSAIADLTKLGLPSTPAPMCSQARVRNRTQGFQDKLGDGLAAYKLSIDPACQMTVAPEGTYATGMQPPEMRTGLLAVDFQSELRGMLVPLAIELLPVPEGGQCAPPVCKLVGPTTGSFKLCLPIAPP